MDIYSLILHFPHPTQLPAPTTMASAQREHPCTRQENRVPETLGGCECKSWALTLTAAYDRINCESISQSIRKSWNSEVKLLLQTSSASEAMRLDSFSFGFFSPLQNNLVVVVYLYCSGWEKAAVSCCTRQCANIAVPALKILQHQKVCFIEEKAIVHLKKKFLC